jgi:hypothetical protein
MNNYNKVTSLYNDQNNKSCSFRVENYILTCANPISFAVYGRNLRTNQTCLINGGSCKF